MLLNRSETIPYVQVKQRNAKLKIYLKTLRSYIIIHQRRDILRTPSNIKDGDFCKNGQEPLAVNCFFKKLLLRSLAGFPICVIK